MEISLKKTEDPFNDIQQINTFNYVAVKFTKCQISPKGSKKSSDKNKENTRGIKGLDC